MTMKIILLRCEYTYFWIVVVKREGEDIFTETIVDPGPKGDGTDPKQPAAPPHTPLHPAADTTRDPPRGDQTPRHNPETHHAEYPRNTALDRRPKIKALDNYLYTWAAKARPRAPCIIANRCRRWVPQLRLYNILRPI